jgi:outer membrane protein TolC
MKHAIRILVLAALPVCHTSAFAQAPLQLTLDEAIARAIAEAPRIAEARARQAAATANIDSRRSFGAPAVSAAGGYLRTNHVVPFGIAQTEGGIQALFPDIPNNYRFRGEVDVPLYTGGRVGFSVASAEADARAAAADVRVAEQDLRLDVIRAYWLLVTARENVGVLQANVQRMDAWVGDVQARVTAGLLPPNDLLSAQAQRAHQNVQLIQARNAAALSEVDLARLIGVDLGQPIVATTPVDQPLAGAAGALTEATAALVAKATAARSERAGLQERQTALRATADASMAGMRPQIAGLAAIEPARPNQRYVPRSDTWNTSWDLGVNVTWAFMDGGRARADRAAAVAQSDAIGQRLRDFDAAIAVEIRQRLLDIESNQAALQAAAEAVSAATEARRVVGERFNAGVATPTDVLDAQNAVLQAELERTQVSAALRLGEARLLRAIGSL